jgi:hypothetical protein
MNTAQCKAGEIARIINWHRHRAAAIGAQLDRTNMAATKGDPGRGDPVRRAELKEKMEHHLGQIHALSMARRELIATVPSPKPQPMAQDKRRVLQDYAMSAGFREQLRNAASALHIRG